MDKKVRQILAVALTSLLSLTAGAKPVDHLDDITATAQAVRDKATNEVTLTLDITLDDLKVGSNDLIILTPRIAQADGSYTQLLRPIYIVGGTRDRALRRQVRFGNEPDYYDTAKPQSITRRQNGMPQQIHYSTTLPYDKQMEGAVLTLEEWLTGCAECDRGGRSLALMTPIFPVHKEPYVPTYHAAFVVPQAEPIKNRSDKYSATIAFRLNKDNIDRSYKDNAAVLDDVDKKVHSVLDDKDITLTGMTVEGWASPEGNADYNRKLSERRAKSFADYLGRRYDLSRADMTVRGRGEDWDGVRRLVEKSDKPYRDALLDIIDSTSGDARDPKVKALQGGAAYRDLLDDIYTQVRRTDYTFAYTVRAFSLEEARERMKTNPKLLSLNEMYLVANSYPTNSADFKEVFTTAARLYPEDAVALINAAAADLEAGDADRALRRLKEVSSSDAAALNNRGVALALTGQYDEAKSCLERAKAQGDTTAALNLAELEKVLDSLD